jgi:hypothetical protein
MEWEKYSVHRCILFAESTFFQQKFTNEWKDLIEGEITIPNKVVHSKVIEAFLLFIYTNLITTQDLKEFLLELFDLSVHLQVKKLQFVCSNNLEDWLTIERAETFLTWNRTHNDSKTVEVLATFLASNFQILLKKSFPFHKVGKTILLKIFKKLAYNVNYNYNYNYSSPSLPKSNVGDPSIHPQFSVLKNGQFSDFVLKWNRNEYLLHKYVLLSGSLYFRILLTSEWKESNSGEIKIPGEGISKKAFEDFLAFLYTGFISATEMEKNLFELYDLSDYFQVASLKDYVKVVFRKYLTVHSAKAYLDHVRERNAPDLAEILAHFIADYLTRLTDFPFEKVGKLMLTKILKRIAAITASPVYGAPAHPPATSSSAPTLNSEEEDEEIEDF